MFFNLSIYLFIDWFLWRDTSHTGWKYVCKNVCAWVLAANPASWDQVALQKILPQTLLWHVTEKEQVWLQCHDRTPMDGYQE